MAGFRFDLTGRVALVTGASSGIGRRFARLLADSGARVVAGARRLDRLDELVAEIAAAGGEALAVPLDVADEASVIAVFDAAEERFGPVDTVVANAGASRAASALGIAAEDFDAVVAVNLRGTFLTVREGARRMIRAGADGRVVIVSSITAHHPTPHLAPYAATKAAVTQMGRTLARDWAGKRVNVNVLAPGWMRTDINDDVWDTPYGRELLEGFPRRRLMGVEALDPLLLFLCSDASAQVTGSVFTADDGQTL